MPTPVTPVRIPSDLKKAVEAKGAGLRLHSTSESILAALEEWAGKEPCPSCTRAAVRIAALEAELAEVSVTLLETRGELAKARAAAMAAAAGHDPASTHRAALSGAEDRFITVLEAASAAFPVSAEDLAAASGYSPSWVRALLGDLRRAGVITQKHRRHYPLPGADIRQTMKEIRDQNERGTHQSTREANNARRRRTPPAEAPEPAPVKHVTPLAASPAPGSAVFQPPGEDAVVAYSAPEVPGRSRKRGRS